MQSNEGLLASACIQVVGVWMTQKRIRPHFCNTTGHELIDSSEADGVFTYRIRKADV